MPELRQDPTTGGWVIIAADRAGRPGGLLGPRRRLLPPYQDDCPFCPGNERETPTATLQRPGRAGEPWSIRVFPNRYPALSPDAVEPPSEAVGTLFRARRGAGYHEVIVETPRHDREVADRYASEVLDLLMVYRDRYNALMARSVTRWVAIFKNSGRRAGASLEHPHSQVMAAPLVPDLVRLRERRARAYRRKEGRCLYCHMARQEAELGLRVVEQDDAFIVLAPFASAHAGETWIVPLEHRASFGRIRQDQLTALAPLLRRTLSRLRRIFGDPEYNYVVHSAPKGMEEAPHLHWFLQIVPRLDGAAGFELASGIYINVLAPEATAQALRKALAD